MMLKPRPLKTGDTIAVAAPASHFDRTLFLEGVRTLEQAGYKVVYRDDIFEKTRYLAGSDVRRKTELLQWLNNDSVQALFFARGGYGMMRLLETIAPEDITGLPKIILGYSDLTSLFLWLLNNKKWIPFYGPVVAKDIGLNMSPVTKNYLLKTLSTAGLPESIQDDDMISLYDGETTGVLTGGCLSLITATLGTAAEIDTQDKILFLEDVNEMPYSIDRMLTQLRLAKKFDKVRGIIVGKFEKSGDPNHLMEVLVDRLAPLQIPILADFPAGHGPIKKVLPLGVKVHLSTTEKKLTYLESPFLI